MSKPKGKIPSLISGSSGKPEPVTAQRKCQCARCGCNILKGVRCFDIPKVGGAFRNTKRYCGECFKSILEQTDKDVSELKVYALVTVFPGTPQDVPESEVQGPASEVNV